MKVLIVEDDERICEPLREHLEHEQNSVVLAADGFVALELARHDRFDLILLDLMIPGIDGLTVCQTLRAEGCSTAIIIITAREKTANKIAALDSGADDYLVKPFDVDELSARMRAVFRRNTETRSAVLRWQDLVLNTDTCNVTYGNQSVDITPTEYRLLLHFLRNPRRTYSKDELVDKLWDKDPPSDAVIKAHIKGLRNKLRAAGAPSDVITTVYGFGYRLKNDAG